MAEIDLQTFIDIVKPLLHEGGFANITHDAETIFGVIKTNMLGRIETMPTDVVADFPPALRTTMQSIKHAKTRTEKLALTGELMEHVGLMLTPLGANKTQPVKGMPLRSSDHELPGLNAEQIREVQAFKDLATKILYEDYAVKPGFSKYPPKLGVQAMDTSINIGPPRTLWMVWEALHETHAISDATYAKLPKLSLHDAMQKNAFADGTRGEVYTKHATQLFVANTIAHLSQDVASKTAENFLHTRIGYYQTLGKSPEYSNRTVGWVARSVEVYAQAEMYELSTKLGHVAPAIQKISDDASRWGNQKIDEVSKNVGAIINSAKQTAQDVKEHFEKPIIDSKRMNYHAVHDEFLVQYLGTPGHNPRIAIQIPGKEVSILELNDTAVTNKLNGWVRVAFPDFRGFGEDYAPKALKAGKLADGVHFSPFRVAEDGQYEATLEWTDNKGAPHKVVLQEELLRSMILHGFYDQNNQKRLPNQWLELVDGQMNPEKSEKVTRDNDRVYVTATQGKPVSQGEMLTPTISPVKVATVDKTRS